MKALIDPRVIVETGVRVCEVEKVLFEVALPLYWVDCPDYVIADKYFYIVETNVFELVPEPPPEIVDANTIVY